MIRFLQDFRGKLTKEHFYPAGEVVTLEEAAEQALVAEGRAEIVQSEPASDEATEGKKRKRKGAE